MMKHLIKLFAIAMCGCSLLAGCNNEEEGNGDLSGDFSPIQFVIPISDADGNDLLDSTRQDNLLKDLTVTYKNQTYNVKTEREAYEEVTGNTTRLIMPIFYGLVVKQSPYYKTYINADYVLTFGEFMGGDTKTHEITLAVADRHQVKLTYAYTVNWKKKDKKGMPEVKQQYFVNGKEVSKFQLIYSATDGFKVP